MAHERSEINWYLCQTTDDDISEETEGDDSDESDDDDMTDAEIDQWWQRLTVTRNDWL